MARYCLKCLFQPLISRLCEEKGRIREQGGYLWWFLRITCPNMYCKNQYWEMRKWFLDCCRQYPTFQLPLFVLVTDTCLEIYNPGNLRTRFLFILNNPYIYLILMISVQGKYRQWDISPQLMACHYIKKAANKTSLHKD